MNRPEKKFRAGPVCATIWKNNAHKDGKNFFFHTVSLERNYKDKDGSWKSSSSLRIHDLPKAALVLTKAFEHLVVVGDSICVSEERLVA